MATTATHREQELLARHLLANQHLIADLIVRRQWQDILAVAKFAAADAPENLIHTDTALYRTLRAQITEFRIRWNFNMELLEQLAAASDPP